LVLPVSSCPIVWHSYPEFVLTAISQSTAKVNYD
jgi:hypothetical protein